MVLLLNIAFVTGAYAQPCGPSVGTILFSEDFEDEGDEATSGTDDNGIAWTATCPGCITGDFFEVDSNSGNAMGCNGTQGLRGNDTNGPGTFNVSGIDISPCEVIYFSFDYCSTGYPGDGNLECFEQCTISGGCSGIPSEGVSDPGCNNCWDFLYGELDWGSGNAQQILLGDDCNVPAFGATGNTLCASNDSNGNPIPPADQMNVDINIVMAMWGTTENMIIDNVVLICYSEADVAGCADADVLDACPPPCGYAEPTVTFTEDCGAFNIAVTDIDESLASGTGTVVSYSTAPVAPLANSAALVTGTEGLVADGLTPYYIQICDAADAACCSEFGPYTAPVGNQPSCETFPANPAGN